MNREYRKQKIQKRMSRIMVREAVAEADKQTTEEFFSGKPLLVGKQFSTSFAFLFYTLPHNSDWRTNAVGTVKHSQHLLTLIAEC